MDFPTNYQPEQGKLEQIISQFLLKSLHIILYSRIPSLLPSVPSGELSSGSRVRKTDKWFNLVLGDRPAVFENLNFWHRNIMEPMIIDIILVHQVPNSSSSQENIYNAAPIGASVETVVERWVVQYEAPRIVAPQIGDNSASYKKTYKKSIILLRSLYSQMRLLPTYRIFRQLTTAIQTYNFDIIYKVSSFGEPFSRVEEGLMEEYRFSPVEALPGRLCISVTYHSILSDFNLEPLTAMPPKIIPDYVGSPNTNPLKSLPSSGKASHAMSFRLRGLRPPSLAPFEHPHSWTSGFHEEAHFMQNQPLTVSPPSHRPYPMSCDSSLHLADTFINGIQNYRPPSNQKATTNYEYHQLSPPFSPLPSPTPPTYLSNGNPNSAQTRPVPIPLPTTGRSWRNFSPNCSDPSRNSLPPLSPRGTRNDPSSQESPSVIKTLQKVDLSRPEEMHSGMTQYGASPKVIKDSKEDSGRFSGILSSGSSPRIGFSRSSSRASFQDDLDDCDFSCPFDVDDVDMSNFQSSQNLDGKKGPEQSLPMVKKSQDAAVGVLVHMLKTAPPLRQDSSYYASQNSKTTDLDQGIGKASGFLVPRKAADALEELRSYKQIKDLLLSKSGTRLVYKEEA